MAGHSRWAQIRHKKAGTDAKRGALFSKLARPIALAARDGGGDPALNPKLRQAMEQAREAGMPKENIERAILRGSGGGEAANLSSVEYEAYGPGGSAFLIAGLTDNPNRTTNEIKNILDKFGGRLAEAGSVAWLFRRAVVFEFDLPAASSAEVLELALIDAGAIDTEASRDTLRVLVAPESSEAFQKHIASRGLVARRQYLAAIPQNPLALDPAIRSRVEALREALDEDPDVTDIWTTVANAAV